MSEIRTTVEPNPDGHLIEYTDFEPAAEPLEALLCELFERHWPVLIFGYCIQGAVFELQAATPPARRPRTRPRPPISAPAIPAT